MNTFSLYNLSQKFAEFTSNTFSEEENILLKHGLTPIQTNGTSFLGNGDYSKVYKVLYKNQIMVAKITRSKRDVENMETLQKIGQYFGDLKKHIPVIYGVLIHKNKFSSPQYIILVEELVPLNKEIKKIIKRRGSRKNY